MPDISPTVMIATYAAIVATTSLLWNIVRDVFYARRRVRLFLNMDGAVQVGSTLVHVMLKLRITNTSMTRDLEIASVDFEGGELVWLEPSVTGGVRPATTEDDVLPALLTPAKSVHIPIYLSEENFQRFYATRGIAVEDSAGRKYRVAQRHFKAMKDRIRKTAAVAAGDPHFLAVRQPR
jgi:hypothetical protein